MILEISSVIFYVLIAFVFYIYFKYLRVNIE